MPGLLRAVGRTAVIAGTATAVSGNVQRRAGVHVLGLHIRLRIRDQPLHDREMALEGGSVQRCLAIIGLGLHVRVPTAHQPASDAQLTART